MPAQGPNVVIVIADDVGWGDLGCYGATAIPTPNVDRLASEGVRLTDCHSSGAVCTPSRYSLLTGRYSWRGPLKSFVLMGHGPAIIETSRPTIASVLHAAGHATGAFGKWHLGLGWRHQGGRIRGAFAPGSRLHDDVETDFGHDVDYTAPFVEGPLELGFDRFFGISGSLDMPPYSFLDQDRTLGIPSRPKERFHAEQRPGLEAPGWDEEQVDVRFVREATRWIREPRDRPFFAYLATSSPHRPCLPPPFIRGRSRAGARGDTVCLYDWAIGELMAAVDDIGAREDTIFIVTSDHGALTYFTDDTDGSAHRPNGPWRGQKGDLWEGGHRVPFVARWPGHVPPGSVRDDLVCLTDVLPTVASATRVPLPLGAAEDGHDVSGVLAGEETIGDERMLVHHSLAGFFALRRGSWKAIFASGPGGGFSEPTIGELFSSGSGKAHETEPWDAGHPAGQLYDLAADPEETTNLWGREPARVAEMYAALKTICRDESSGLPFDVPLGSALRVKT